MSEDFANRLEAIRSAYVEKSNARKRFTAAWSKISSETVKPTLDTARRAMNHFEVSIDLKGDGHNGLNFTVSTLPLGKGGEGSQQLSYRPRLDEEVIAVTMKTNEGTSDIQSFPLDTISVDLIECHVEDFLKRALKLRS